MNEQSTTKQASSPDPAGVSKRVQQTIATLHTSIAELPSAQSEWMQGNLHALKHGIFANRIMDERELEIFTAIIAQLEEDYVFNRSVDFIQLELVGIYFLQLGRAILAERWDAADTIDRMLRSHLKELKATKRVREGDGPIHPGTTPAEWATDLLERLAAQPVNQETNSSDAQRTGRKTRK
jgi:hypothetical protein